jgi:hypothetical protein
MIERRSVSQMLEVCDASGEAVAESGSGSDSDVQSRAVS